MHIARRAALLLVALALAAAALPAASAPAPNPVAKLSLREKVGQLVMFAPRGAYLSATEKALIERHHLGGLIIFSGNY
jgi:hypothetical protein